MIKILLVDDSEIYHEYMKFFLEKAGYEVYSAYDGETGIESAWEIKPDLILMDMDMPIMDGFEATSNLRKQGYKGLIAACTSSLQDSEIIEAGCNDIIKKPFSTKELLEKIKDILS